MRPCASFEETGHRSSSWARVPHPSGSARSSFIVTRDVSLSWSKIVRVEIFCRWDREVQDRDIPINPPPRRLRDPRNSKSFRQLSPLQHSVDKFLLSRFRSGVVWQTTATPQPVTRYFMSNRKYGLWFIWKTLVCEMVPSRTLLHPQCHDDTL